LATYIVGDLQGCCDELEVLLDAVSFSAGADRLWLAGDLVNRGARSLDTLRLLRGLGESVRIVLGNHDLHFLAVFYGGHEVRRSDTLDALLCASDVEELASWLRTQPLVYHESQLGWLMVHAGIPPLWALDEVLERAEEARQFYSGIGGAEFFAGMYGNTPARWDEALQGLDRVRCIVNYLTRMRLVAADGTLDFALKGVPTDLPEGFLPWFLQPRTAPLGAKIAFGHWAALEGRLDTALDASVEVAVKKSSGAPILPDAAALDTGCVWGRTLTALELGGVDS
jgi:bis(5'-nucleosyl)-tetraphosphatase (symmetrical)